MSVIKDLLEKSIDKRNELIEKLHQENTNAYRLFHGTVEGWHGLNIDRYADLILIQSFREPLSQEDIEIIHQTVQNKMQRYNQGNNFYVSYNHRGENKEKGFDYWHKPSEEALKTQIIKEIGLNYFIKARHRGQDPFLFLDMRAGRRFILNNSQGLSFLNLFAYTSGSGIAAMAGGAKEVWNIDFASSSMEIGKENAILNNFLKPEFKLIKSDVFAALRQLTGTPFKGRNSKMNIKPEVNFEEKQFDLVFLDPPAFSKSPFGTVDLIRDYQSIFKLSLLATKTGGRIIAVNNVAKVDINDWTEILKRCATKAGRNISNIEIIEPEADFPSWDKNFPLKIAVCDV